MGETAAEPALEAAWRADADQGAHEQGEIEPARVNQHAFADVGVAAQMRAAEPPGAIQMRKRPLEPFAAIAQQTFAAGPADAPTIPIDRVACLGFAVPVAPAAMGLGDVGADSDRFKIH